MQCEDTVLNGIVDNKTVDMDFLLLTQSMDTVESLTLNRFTPPEIEGDHSVGASQVKADTTTFQTIKWVSDIARILDAGSLPHKHDTGLLFSHEAADGSVTLVPCHVSLVFDVGESFLN